jgi:hypothetical protein
MLRGARYKGRAEYFHVTVFGEVIDFARTNVQIGCIGAGFSVRRIGVSSGAVRLDTGSDFIRWNTYCHALCCLFPSVMLANVR